MPCVTAFAQPADNKRLEEELGERLSDRTKRQAKLTALGRRFLQRAIRILEEVDAAIASLPIQEEQVHTETLFAEELLAAVPRNHPMVKRKSIRHGP